MAGFWTLLGRLAPCLTVLGWLVTPIITFLLNKLMTKVCAYLADDTSRKLRDLELTVPDLEETLSDVEEKRKLIAAEDETSASLERLDKMKKDLQSALYDAEDILDLVNYHRIEQEVRRNGKQHGSIWVKQLHDAARCLPSRFREPVTQGIEMTLLALLVLMVAIAILLRRFIRPLCRRFMGTIQPLCRRFMRRRSSAEAGSTIPISVSPSIQITNPEAVSTRVSEPISIQDDIMWGTMSCLHWFKFRCMDHISTCCRPMLSGLAHAVAWVRFSWDCLTRVIVKASSYRDWSYEQVGIDNKQDDTGLDSFLLTINRKRLRERIEHIENIVTGSKNSSLLKKQSSCSDTPINDSNKKESSSTMSKKKKESSSKPEEIDDLHKPLRWEVYGRNTERDDICGMFRNGPSLSSSKHYSVIGIYGVAGSGKTTLAQYVRDYERDQNYFDLVMSTRVSTDFSKVHIFRDMLKQMRERQPSDDKNLEEELKKRLTGKKFLLVLDDVWVSKKKNRKELEDLSNVLNSGSRGSGVLVTAQREDATRALGAEKPIKLLEMEAEQYFSMFMYHALKDSSITDRGKHEVIGRKIVEKLHGSPIAAVTVAAQLSTNTDIKFWDTTAKDDLLDETKGALKWSYQQLGAGVRRCFEYCSTFPKGFSLERDDLVRMWIAQGFVRKRNAKDDIYQLGQRYFDELLSFSFLQRTYDDDKYCTMHDLLHELSEEVAGKDYFFRFGVNGSPNDIPREVRHLRIVTDNFAGIMETILQLGNLRTLIIEEYILTQIIDRYDRGTAYRNLFLRLRKLRVLIVKTDCHRELELSVPASIGQMKHLRYLSFRSTGWGWLGGNLKLMFPCTFSKLYHMQTLDIPQSKLSCAEDIADLIHLRHFSGCLNFPNIVMPMSLEMIPRFEVREGQGCKLKQLEDLNKLRTLEIRGLGFVTSKEEALEANLGSKNQLNELELNFYSHGSACNPDVQAAVLEGLCPSKDLVHLNIENYSGSSYPSWMLYPCWSGQNPEPPKELYSLELFRCSRLVYIPEGSGYFIRLHKLCFSRCRWSCLPDNMERLESLHELTISLCGRIKRLPVLPQSLKHITVTGKSKLWKTCQIEGHENRQKIEYIPKKEFPVETEDGFLY